MSAETTAWLILIFGYFLPLAHVALSPAGGPWRPLPGAACPFGPRTGWLVVVLLSGILGWLLYMAGRLKRRRGSS